MAYLYNNKDTSETLTTDSVAGFIAANPDFFQQHPDLLASLNLALPQQGNVASLIERQVAVLRENNAQLQQELENEKGLSTYRKQLQQHVYSLTFEIMHCKSLNELSGLLRITMQEWFAASYARLFVFGHVQQEQQVDLIHFTGADYRVQDMFSGLFTRKKPLCSSLQLEHLQVLFGNAAEKIKSNVVIPVLSPSGNGLLALGSANWDQYGQGEELDALVFLSELYFLQTIALVD